MYGSLFRAHGDVEAEPGHGVVVLAVAAERRSTEDVDVTVGEIRGVLRHAPDTMPGRRVSEHSGDRWQDGRVTEEALGEALVDELLGLAGRSP